MGMHAVVDELETLSHRERDVLALMAAGLSNAGIARELWLTERTVEAHIGRILTKLTLDHEGRYNRRVLAVLAYVDAVRGSAPGRTA